MSSTVDDFLGSSADSALAKEKPFSEARLQGTALFVSRIDRCFTISLVLCQPEGRAVVVSGVSFQKRKSGTQKMASI
jgi:hypothetical protein